MNKIKPIQNHNWVFHVDNKANKLPYLSARSYTLIKQSIVCNKLVNKRVLDLVNRGFMVKRCYVPSYNGLGQISYFPTKNEIRIIIGRPYNHAPREVFAVIINA